MLTSRRSLLFGALLIAAVDHIWAVDSPGDGLVLSIEVPVNPLAGHPQAGCKTSATVETPRQKWWVTFARAKPDPETHWQAVGSAVACGSGGYDGASSDENVSPEADYLIVSLSTAAGFLPSSLIPERVLVLNITLSVKNLSKFGEEDKPIYRESKEKRGFYFLEGGEAFVPLLVADDTETEAFGVREVLLHVKVGPIEDPAAATYGSISVRSGIEEGGILLDGGVVGKVSTDRETVLRNVRTGVHLVGVRDSSGREIRKVARVEADRTVPVELNDSNLTQHTSHYRLESLGTNAEGYEEYRRGADGAVVVKIPAGAFLMGNRETEGAPLEHQVYVPAFLMDKTGVAWGQYKRFAAATGTPLPPRDPYWGLHDDHPAVYVTWEEAKTYCEWAGGRLPTEAEREKAARGMDGRKYPWGNEEPEPHLGVFRRNWGEEATAPVGTHPAGASPYGLLDMGGNVWEWCSDWYDKAYYAVSTYRDPRGPRAGRARVVRGGSWDSRPTVLSASARNFGYRGYREGDFGFRCAMNASR